MATPPRSHLSCTTDSAVTGRRGLSNILPTVVGHMLNDDNCEVEELGCLSHVPGDGDVDNATPSAFHPPAKSASTSCPRLTHGCSGEYSPRPDLSTSTNPPSPTFPALPSASSSAFHGLPPKLSAYEQFLLREVLANTVDDSPLRSMIEQILSSPPSPLACLPTVSPPSAYPETAMVTTTQRPPPFFTLPDEMFLKGHVKTVHPALLTVTIEVDAQLYLLFAIPVKALDLNGFDEACCLEPDGAGVLLECIASPADADDYSAVVPLIADDGGKGRDFTFNPVAGERYERTAKFPEVR